MDTECHVRKRSRCFSHATFASILFDRHCHPIFRFVQRRGRAIRRSRKDLITVQCFSATVLWSPCSCFQFLQRRSGFGYFAPSMRNTFVVGTIQVRDVTFPSSTNLRALVYQSNIVRLPLIGCRCVFQIVAACKRYGR